MQPAEQPAASSRDWSVLPEDEIIDQATDLPEAFTFDTGLNCPLDNRAKFGLWLRGITLILQEHGLEKLIDIRIARPFRQSTNSKRWVEFSRKIQHWLTKNMSDALIQEITTGSHGARLQLADEFIEQAKKTFMAPGIYADMEGVASFMSMNISSFASARDFAWGLKDQFNTLWEKKGVRIPPYFALLMLLNRLDTMEHRHVVACAISELQARATQGELWSTFTNVDFHVSVFNIIQRLERTGKAAIVPALVRPATYEAHKRAGSFLYGAPPPGVKYFPPIGANEDEYAAGLRASLPQITMDKNCAYCGQRYHIASKCYYLNPETRPHYWRGLDDIWTYKKGQYNESKADENTSVRGIGSYLENRAVSLPASMITRVPDDPWWDTTPSQTPSKTSARVDTQPTPTLVDTTDQTDVQPDTSTDTPAETPIDTPIDTQPDVPVDAQPAPETAVQSTDQTAEDDNQEGDKQEDTGSATETLAQDQFEDVRDWVSLEDSPFDAALKFNKNKSDWVVFNSGHVANICADRNAFTELHEYGPNEPHFTWHWVIEGTRERKGVASAKGKGKVSINVDYDNNETENLVFDAFYYPESRFSIFFTENAVVDHDLKYDNAKRIFLDIGNNMKPLGGTVMENGYTFLRMSTEEAPAKLE